MADQDFNINIRTLADTTGIKITQAQLDALQTSAAAGNQKATAALQQLFQAQSQAQESASAGLGATAAGVGTIISLVTVAISKWKAFNDELDKQVEKMIQAEEKMRKLGESIIDTQDKMIARRRVDQEPLEQSFARLKYQIEVLKTEQSLLDLPRQGDEWNELNKKIAFNESLLHIVTSAMDKQKDAAIRNSREKEQASEREVKALEKELSLRRQFEQSALEGSSAQAHAILKNEEAARQARAQGRERDADLFQKTADRLKQSATADQLEEYRQLRRTQPQSPRTVEQWRNEQQEATNRFNEQMGPAAIQRWRNEQQRMTDEFYGKEGGKESQSAGSDVVAAIHELRDLWK